MTCWGGGPFARTSEGQDQSLKMSPDFKYSFQGTCGTFADNIQEETWGESSEGRAIFHTRIGGN